MGHIGPLTEEETDTSKISGQMVHEAMYSQFEKMLGTYSTLSNVATGGSLENPLVSKLVASNVRVIYFWEGQQVLCLDLAECSHTPGWEKGPAGYNLAFGEPKALGERPMEPGCALFYDDVLKSALPETIVTGVKHFA